MFHLLKCLLWGLDLGAGSGGRVPTSLSASVTCCLLLSHVCNAVAGKQAAASSARPGLGVAARCGFLLRFTGAYSSL